MGKLVARQGLLCPLGVDEGQWVMENTDEAIRIFMTAVQQRFEQTTLRVTLKRWAHIEPPLSSQGIDLVLISLAELGFDSPRHFQTMMDEAFYWKWSKRNLRDSQTVYPFHTNSIRGIYAHVCDVIIARADLTDGRRIWILDPKEGGFVRWNSERQCKEGYSLRTDDANDPIAKKDLILCQLIYST